MRVRVRLFAGLRESVGTGELVQELPAGSTVRALVDRLVEQYPALGTRRCMFAVNSTYVTPQVELHDGDEVALIPPVGGG